MATRNYHPAPHESDGALRKITFDDLREMRAPGHPKPGPWADDSAFAQDWIAEMPSTTTDQTLYAVLVIPVDHEGYHHHGGFGGSVGWAKVQKHDVLYATADGKRVLEYRTGRLEDAPRAITDHDWETHEPSDGTRQTCLDVLDEAWPDEIVEVDR